MKKEEIQIWKRSFKILSHILIPATAMNFIADPIFAAGVSNFFLQTLYGLQSDIKQKRVNNLLLGVEELLKLNNPNLKIEQLNKQELRDIFETAIINASKANSEKKISRLGKILYGQIVNPQPYDYTTRYLDLALKLNDDQVKILKIYVETENKLLPLQKNKSIILKTIQDSKEIERKIFSHDSTASQKQKNIFLKKKEESKTDLNKLNLEINSIINIRRKNVEEYDENVFSFIFNDLLVLGLIYNPSEGLASYSRDKLLYNCTVLSLGFIKFLYIENLKS
jgi:hypothetical protein